MELAAYEIQQLLAKSAQMALVRHDVNHGHAPATIDFSKAASLYGAKTVSRWIKEKRIEVIQDGKNASRRFDLVKLTDVALTAGRMEYLTTAERN